MLSLKTTVFHVNPECFLLLAESADQTSIIMVFVEFVMMSAHASLFLFCEKSFKHAFISACQNH